jgi:hypothetical protein
MDFENKLTGIFEKLDWIVEFKFIPWRGAYAIGLPHLMAAFLLLLPALFVLFIYLLNQKIQHGPLADDLELAYHPR